MRGLMSTHGVTLLMPLATSLISRPLSQNQLAQWREALLSKSPRSAAGPDGLTRDDLLAFPTCLTQQILDILASAEVDGQWPHQLLDGVIACLEKTPGACTVSQYRPICILSMVYRVWSSVRAKQALAHLAKYAPPGMLGNVPGSSSSDAWYTLMLQVEEAYATGSVLYGLSTDLIKAFNHLHRLPVAAFARVCGIPNIIVLPWVSAMTKLRRRFRVRGSVGPPLLSSTGFAEGDPLSCMAMAILNIAFHFNFDSTPGVGRCLTFVDNWHATASSLESVQASFTAISSFATAWDVPIDLRKTVFWSTSLAGRRHLRDLGFQVDLDFREPGAHFQSSRRRTNFSQQDRISALDEKWPRLECCSLARGLSCCECGVHWGFPLCAPPLRCHAWA